MTENEIKNALSLIQAGGNLHLDDWQNIVSNSIKKHLTSFNFSGSTSVDEAIKDVADMIRVGHKYKKSGLKHVLANDLNSILLTRRVET